MNNNTNIPVALFPTRSPVGPVIAWLFLLLVGIASLSISPMAAASPGLGTVSFVSFDGTCLRRGDDCWLVEVKCSGLDDLRGNLRINYPDYAVPVKGVVLLTEGGSGNTFWGSKTNAAYNAMKGMIKDGYITVELAWKKPWWADSSATLDGSFQGYADVSCRPASIARYVKDVFVTYFPDRAYCATGTSGGATQIAFALSHYGLHSDFDFFMPVSGPPVADIGIGCYRTPGHESMWYSTGTSQTIDQVFGVDRQGPCVVKDEYYRSLYTNSSAGVGGDLLFPGLPVHFVFGGGDTTSAVGQGEHYAQLLIDAGNGLVSSETVPDAPHNVHANFYGAEVLRDRILSECRKR
jgi:pimeloyl-ACP methyl ester carboxylesterase